MKTAAALIGLTLSMALFAQVRLVPHVTSSDGGFETTVILLNSGPEEAPYTLTPYTVDGQVQPPVSGTLLPGEKIEEAAAAFFANSRVSHFLVDAGELLQVSVSYRRKPDGGPAHVNAAEREDFHWVVYNGDWQSVWDGFAVVNLGSSPTPVTVLSVDAGGNLMDSFPVTEALAPFAKALFVLGSEFAPNPNGYFQIESQQPTAITALRGNLVSTFLWENSAVAGPGTLGKCKWALEMSGTGSRLLDVSWDGARFVAGGDNAFLTSQDGHQWQAASFGDDSFILSVASSGNLFVAVGGAGRILSSTDGQIWQQQNSGTPVPLNNVLWNGGEFAVVGQSGTLLTSTDAMDWQRQNLGSIAFLFGLAFGQDRYVAVGDQGTIVTGSPDTAWESVASGVTTILRDAVFANGLFVAVGDQGVLLTSPDGLAWTLRNTNTSAILRDVTWDGARFVAVGDQGAIVTSETGETWMLQGLCTLESLCGTAWTGQTLVAVGDAGTVLSLDQ